MSHTNPILVTGFFRAHALPEPVPEFKIVPERRFRWDWAWPMHRLAIEVQGGIWNRGAHGRGSGIQRDHEKSNLATIHGWRVLYVVPTALLTTATAQMVQAVIGAGRREDVRP